MGQSTQLWPDFNNYICLKLHSTRYREVYFQHEFRMVDSWSHRNSANFNCIHCLYMYICNLYNIYPYIYYVYLYNMYVINIIYLHICIHTYVYTYIDALGSREVDTSSLRWLAFRRSQTLCNIFCSGCKVVRFSIPHPGLGCPKCSCKTWGAALVLLDLCTVMQHSTEYCFSNYSYRFQCTCKKFA